MSPAPRLDEFKVSIWNNEAYVIDNGRFEVLTTTHMPIFDFDRYGGFRKSDIVTDIQKAWKNYAIPFTARLYYTANGVRMILPSHQFAKQKDMLEFAIRMPHMDQLYLKYTLQSKVYRARLTVKPARISKQSIVSTYERIGVCLTNKFAVTTYIGTLQPVTGQIVDMHQYEYSLYRKKVASLTEHDMIYINQTNAVVPTIFNIQYDTLVPYLTLVQPLPTILKYDVHSNAAFHRVTQRSIIMLHDIITGAYLRSFKLL